MFVQVHSASSWGSGTQEMLPALQDSIAWWAKNTLIFPGQLFSPGKSLVLIHKLFIWNSAHWGCLLRKQYNLGDDSRGGGHMGGKHSYYSLPGKIKTKSKQQVMNLIQKKINSWCYTSYTLGTTNIQPMCFDFISIFQNLLRFALFI